MLSSRRKLLCSFIFLGLALKVQCEDTADLKPGDPAPQLYASQWLNGDAVSGFQNGTTYVVECWATWCAPCRVSIPHLSELNLKYKDRGVVIIGVDVMEKDASLVEPFVKEMGAKMNYLVALDDDGKTAKAWLKASGQGGIPCAFVVDKDGKIAWIGHPMRLEPVLEQILAGTFDIKKYAEAQAQAMAQARKIDELKRAMAEAASKHTDNPTIPPETKKPDEPRHNGNKIIILKDGSELEATKVEDLGDIISVTDLSGKKSEMVKDGIQLIKDK